MKEVLKSEQRPEAEKLMDFMKKTDKAVTQRFVGFMEGYEAGQESDKKKRKDA